MQIMGMVGTMDIPTRCSCLVILDTMREKEARGYEAAIGMTWVEFKVLLVEEFCPSKEMVVFQLSETRLLCQSLLGAAVRIENNQRVCYECGSSEHLRNTCPKLNREPSQAGKCLALEGNRNTQNNGNQARGRAFSVNAVDALQDPNIVMSTFSLNDHFATVLFDSRAYFNFISTKFAPLLNVKPSIVSPGYVIEVANAKKEEVDVIISDCKLELGNSLFTIDFIPLGHRSFDVIVGMDWLCKNKAEIVCHEKMVRIPLEKW
ncbi:putative reverse transcriptase domain-containing protein [Tanacetum coccineum]